MMEAREMALAPAERTRKGIWYVVGSVPLLTEVLMLVLDRLHRLALFIIVFLDFVIIAAAFACAALLVRREQAMVIGTRHCIEYSGSGLPGLELPTSEPDPWFQSWKIDDDDVACTRVEPNAAEEYNRELFRNFFVDGKLHTSFQMPLRRNRVLNPFKPFNRYMKGYISIDLDLSDNATRSAKEASLRLRLGGRDGGGRQPSWDQLGRTQVPLSLEECERRSEQAEDGSEAERCVVNQRLFEVASLDREYYLLNVGVQNMTQPPLSINLLVIYQTRLYTLVCLNIQACFTGLLLLLLALYLYRVRRLYRPAAPTSHRLVAGLALAAIVWDVPIGYIGLDYSLSWLGILDAIRLDLFYLVFLAFCVVFVREQAFVKGVRRPLRRYLPALLPLLLACLLLLALDLSQQSLQLSDVFLFRPAWLRFLLAALLILNALYVVALCAAAGLSCRSGWRREKVPGRYRAAMALTCLTAAAACVEHAERRESDNYWFWSWTEQRPTDGHLLYIGMLVWYNVFVATLLILYTPTRPLVELGAPEYQDEQKVPLNGGDGPEPIKRQPQPEEP